ncbi:hypothetical protein KAR91_40235 [Candidatus Pacearchaeota archaeon]|nr:hypothetical protein [Candidatus Pacearchaeota archaeon]
MDKIKNGLYTEKADDACKSRLSSRLRTQASTKAKEADDKYRQAARDIYQLRRT